MIKLVLKLMLLMVVLLDNGYGQERIKIIGVNDSNRMITRFDSSYIEITKCSMYDYYGLVEVIDSVGVEISRCVKEGSIVYYLVNVEARVGMMMIMMDEDVCRVTSWYDGYELRKLIVSKKY